MYCFESFLKGYKPAVLMNPNHDDENDIRSLIGYPFVENIQVFASAGQVLYFQNEQLKQDYFYQSKDTPDPHSPEFHKLLGITLGFPPKASQFYSETVQDESLSWKKIGFEYCGICCVGALEDIKENVEWFWQPH
ncbi:hypothetical protein [Shimazuella kribbensis]|uniref:hypothetical protein n=1 Tax=Shimazuella kribbensis TaxID=139808 RepID=UPI0003F672FF|nr:hypothetical protein [Shimazuella kribbensis]